MSIDLDPRLLSADHGQSDDPRFSATLRANGEYMPLAFVLRLSPMIHQTLAKVPSGIYFSGEVGFEGAQAFSTYLHETIHWWQHIGSTYGLMSSLSYPTRAHANHAHLKELATRGALKKPVMQMAARSAGGRPAPETVGGLVNVIVNNHFDLNAYSRFGFNQELAKAIVSSNMFESLGHAFRMTIGHNLLTLAATVDRDFMCLPDPRKWDGSFRKLKEDKVEGFYYGSPVGIWPLGAQEIMEGQACFSQMQYLHFASGGRLEWDTFRGIGMLHGVYEAAFKLFLQWTEMEWPDSINDPVVGLFLLVCDLAINSGSGFPFDPFPHYQSLITDTLPGTRFQFMARTIRLKIPGLLGAIRNYSRAEYEDVSEQIGAALLVRSPLRIARECRNWTKSGLAGLMEEYRTYDYQPTNHAVRVLFSHFLAFNEDKFMRPEFFCWPGAWMSGKNLSEAEVRIFERHGALFVDRESDSGIYPRMREGYEESAIQRMFDDFYGATVVYEMTDQLITRNGPFQYEYGWLKPSAEPAEFKEFVDSRFKASYGVAPDDIPVF